MIFTIENLGIIEKAEIDLSKDLIVLYGQNNTGKTSLAYSIYYLWKIKQDYAYFLLNLKFKFLREQSQNILSLIESEIKNYNVSYGFNVNLISVFHHIKEYKKVILADLCQQYAENIGNFFSFPSHLSFSSIKVSLDIPDEEIERRIYVSEIKYSAYFNRIPEGEANLTVSKQTHSEQLVFMFHSDEHDKGTEYIAEEVFKIIIDSIVNFSAYVAPFERSAISTFNKELSLTRNRIFDKLLKADKYTDELIELLNRRVNRYPQPIRDSLTIVADISVLKKNPCEFNFLSEELERMILKGKMIISEEGDIYYLPEGTTGPGLDMHLTGSSVKSLCSIIFYLRYLAKRGDYIIIDEPELSLHPDSQILMARFLAQPVNNGFKVIISTHSDYLMREINNLIMLSQPQAEPLMNIYGYTPSQLLKPSQVNTYLFKQNQRTPQLVPVNEKGINLFVLDEISRQLSKVSDHIQSVLFEQEENPIASK